MYMRRSVDTLTTPTMSSSDLELGNGFQTGQLHPGVSDIRQFEKHISQIDKLVRVRLYLRDGQVTAPCSVG